MYTYIYTSCDDEMFLKFVLDVNTTAIILYYNNIIFKKYFLLFWLL